MIRLMIPAVVAIALCGCGGSVGVVKGTVSMKGTLLSQGRVSLTNGKGYMETVDIQPDGSYRFENVPVGTLKIGVESPDPVELKRLDAERKKAEKAGMPMRGANNPITIGDPAKWIPIPARYAIPEDSGLTVEVSSGENDHPINLN